MLSDEEFARRARALEWLVFDVDGVLTDGRLIYGPEGEHVKVFHVRDGLALKLAQRAGLKVGILSGRTSGALAARAQDLALDAVILDRSDKAAAFAEFLAARGVDPERVAYAGDDLLDLPVLRRTAGECMHPHPRTIAGEELASAALNEMEEHRITSLFVCDAGGRLEGIVHLHDLWRLELF